MSNVITFTGARGATPGEVRARRHLIVPAWRFAILNVKMIVMVTKGHH